MNYYTIPGIAKNRPIEKEFIIEVICEVCNTNMEMLKKRNRKRELVMARHFICYFLRKRTSLSLKSIGNGIDTIRNLLCIEDPSVMEGIRLIKLQLD